ncbi:MAG: glycine zipper 2TM domain-containing protein [Burkholderiaceae bacterium]
MNMKKVSGAIHPLIAAAAVSVIIASLVGVAAITGLFPKSDSMPSPPSAQVISTPAATEKITPAAPLAKHSRPKQLAPAASNNSEQVAQSSTVPANDPVCSNCGKVLRVRAIDVAAKPSGIGVVAGAVLGGVLGNQVGGGTGKTLATVAGAAAGGYAGNEVEKRTRKTSSYEVDVQMDDGSTRTVAFETQPNWQAGDRVKIVNGALVAR